MFLCFMTDLETKDKIDAAEKAIEDAKAAIVKAKAAGINTGDLETTLEEEEAKLRALKEAYGG